MDNKPFETPVVVELGHVGKYRQIRSTQEAAECLMTVWPLNRGRAIVMLSTLASKCWKVIVRRPMHAGP